MTQNSRIRVGLTTMAVSALACLAPCFLWADPGPLVVQFPPVVSNPVLTFSGEVYSRIEPQSIVVRNTGTVPVEYAVRSDVFWLSISNASVQLVAGGETSHTVHVATRGLHPRIYNGQLLLTATEGPAASQAVPVTLSIRHVETPSILKIWGVNDADGRMNIPHDLSDIVSVVANSGSPWGCALRSDGAVEGWGAPGYGCVPPPPEATNLVALAVSYSRVEGLKRDGTVLAWGNEETYVAPVDATGLVEIATSGNHTLGVRANGTVLGWGGNWQGQAVPPPGLSNVVSVAAAASMSYALTADGRVTVWGAGYSGELVVPPDLTNAVAITAYGSRAVALRADGTITMWGYAYGITNIPAEFSDLVDVQQGDSSLHGIKSDGRVVRCGTGALGDAPVPEDVLSVKCVSDGPGFTVALMPIRTLSVTSLCDSVPPAGTQWFVRDVLMTSRVDAVSSLGPAQYVCIGWTGGGSVPASGLSNVCTFPLTEASSITWNWQLTNYWLETVARGGGRMDATSAWCRPGTVVEVQATPDAGSAFINWTGDTNGCQMAGSHITVPMTQGRALAANFSGAGVLPLSTVRLDVTGTVQGAIAPRQITVTNYDDHEVAYRLVSDSFWVSPADPDVVLPAGGSRTHEVRFETRGLQALTYDSQLSLYCAGVTAGIPVRVVMQRLPSMHAQVRSWGFNQYDLQGVPGGLESAVDVAAGEWHSIALLGNRGGVAVWGADDHDTDDFQGMFNIPSDVTNGIAVSASSAFNVVLKADGRVSSWGWRQFQGSYNAWNACNPTGLVDAIAVDAGDSHALALRSNGTVFAWSVDPANTNLLLPAGLCDVVAVSAGNDHSLALRRDGRVIAWGNNDSGETDVPADLTNAVAISAGGDFSLALCGDGTVRAWGTHTNGLCDVAAGLTNAIAVSAGTCLSLALRVDGTVASWGHAPDYWYRYEPFPSNMTGVVDVDAGWGHGLALQKLLPVVVESEHGTPTPPVGTNWMPGDRSVFSNVTETVGSTQYVCRGWTATGSLPGQGSGESFAASVTSDSSVCWSKWETNYWISLVATGGGIIQAESGWYTHGSNVTFTATEQPGCSFVQWEGDTQGAIVYGSAISFAIDGPRALNARFTGPCISASRSNALFEASIKDGPADMVDFMIVTNRGDGRMEMTVRSDVFWLSAQPTVVLLGAGEWAPLAFHVSTLGLAPRTYTGSLTLSAPYATNAVVIPVVLRVTAPSAPVCLEMWGSGASNTLTPPAGLTNVVAMSTCDHYSLALKSDGRVVGWGTNYWAESVPPEDLTNAVAVACEYSHALAVTADGHVRAWGYEAGTQLSVPSDLTNAVAVAVGTYFSMALTQDGRVVQWGSNLALPAAPLSNVVAIAAGGNHALALHRNGTVSAWGAGQNGQLTIPAFATHAVAVAAGETRSLVLLADGTVVGWGEGFSGAAQPVPEGLSNVVAIARADNRAAAVCRDGSIAIWGGDVPASLIPPDGLGRAFGVAVDDSHAMALMAGHELRICSADGTGATETRMVPAGSVQRWSVVPSFTSGGTQRVCSGWSLSGPAPVSGVSNTASFCLEGDSTLTWSWSPFAYWLESSHDGDGTVEPASGWIPCGRVVELKAKPALPDIRFAGWSGSFGGACNPLSFTMDETCTARAHFDGAGVTGHPVHYAWAGCPTPVAPYTNWATAADSLQDAVDAAHDGDLVLVQDGIYATGRAGDGSRVRIDRSLRVQSVNGPAFTRIDGGQGRCVTLTNATLAGFMLTNGVAGMGGGALALGGTLSNCIVTVCQATGGYGGGVFGGVVIDSILKGNYATSDGGGACLATLIRCHLDGNIAGDDGGAASACPLLENCLITANRGGGDAGGIYSSAARYCTFYANTGFVAGAVYGGSIENCVVAGPSGEPQVSSATSVASSWVGVDPGFMDAANGDFHLAAGSSAIDAAEGTNGPDVDRAGVQRPLDGDGNGVACPDLGAYEFEDATDHADPDGDGMSNDMEALAGTDGHSDSSVFGMSELGCVPETGATHVVFCWQSVHGRRYSVQSSSNILSAWDVTSATNMPGSGGLLSYTNRDPAARYFRLHVRRP